MTINRYLKLVLLKFGEYLFALTAMAGVSFLSHEWTTIPIPDALNMMAVIAFALSWWMALVWLQWPRGGDNNGNKG